MMGRSWEDSLVCSSHGSQSRGTRIRRPSRGTRRRRGFSLLETILAMALLAGVMAVVGDLVIRGLDNARYARDLTRAQLVCESQLAAITAGVVLVEPVTDVPVDYDPMWLYSVSVDATDEIGLVMVRVTVRENAAVPRPVEFSLVRWMPDPGVELGGEANGASTTASATGE